MANSDFNRMRELFGACVYIDQETVPAEVHRSEVNSPRQKPGLSKILGFDRLKVNHISQWKVFELITGNKHAVFLREAGRTHWLQH